jgi:hypothetical protein
VPDKIRIGGGAGSGFAQIIEPRPRLLERDEAFGDFDDQLLVLPKRIQHAPVRGVVEQPAIVGLAVDFDQQSAQIAQQPHADRLIVRESAGAAIGGDGAAQDHFVFGRNVVLLQQREGRVLPVQIENGDRRSLRRAGANAGTSPGPRASGEPQGIEQNGFPRPRLTRKHVETGREIQRHVLDQNEVANLERREHATSL